MSFPLPPRRPWLPILPALLASALHGAGFNIAEERYTFVDGGQPRVFAPLRDEVAIRNKDGVVHRTPLAASTDTKELLRRTRALRPLDGEKVELILVEPGADAADASRLRYLRSEVILEAESEAAARSAAAAAGLAYSGPATARRFHLLAAASSADALEALPVLAVQPGILRALPSLARQQSKRLVPNDPYFANQWHLRNTGQSSGTAGVDVNVVNVWDNYRGSGLRIGIVDDGLQTAHPDLSANVDTTNDHDWNDSTPDDPNPTLSADFHGTACAGVAAARGNNALGVSGAAPEATLVGLRLIGAGTTDTQEADALAWKNDLIAIKSNSWGPNDDGVRLEGPGPLTLAALETATTTGRGGLGTIFLWAGGNGGDVGDNSNYDGYANSIYTVAVGAVTNTGARSYYSEPGANLVVCAPSNGGADPGITTVDLVGNDGYNYSGLSGNLSDRGYTNDFGGTSSATPLAAGVVALLLQSRPTLGWRDVQEILMKSATQVSSGDADWTTNAGGFRFNHKFGAGLVNASAAIALAQTWTNLPAATSQSLALTSLARAIPDNNSAGTSTSFDLSANANLRAEHVTVTVNISHASRGQLAVTLTSPQGTVSRLAEKHSDTGDNYADWTFMTVRNWGEATQGVWTLTVSDLTSGTTGVLNGATLKVYGTPAAALNRRPSVGAASLGFGELFAENVLSLSGVATSDPESDAVSLAYQWQLSADNTTFSDIAGATSASLPADALRAGRIVRCRLTPSDAGGPGAAFFTAARALNRRPPVLAATGAFYAYDSELYVADRSAAFTRPALINEFSQGASGSKEWVEILVLAPSDLRDWTLTDRTTTPVLTFSQNALWSAVPAGTLLVVYNGADRDSILPADQTTLGAGKTLVIPHSNTTCFSGSWPALSNSNADLLVLRNASGTLVDGVSYGTDTTHTPQLAQVGSQKSAAFQGDSDAGAELAVNWLVQGVASGIATPAAGNGATNTAFVANLASGAFSQPAVFRLGASSQTPAGLALDPATGLLSGTLSAAPGVYAIVIERDNGGETASQTLRLLVTDADGFATIPAGSTWAPTTSTTIAGDLVVAGTLDTSGQALTVQGVLTIAGGTVLNAGPGSLAYGGLAGGSLTGTVVELPTYANWIAGYPSLAEAQALPSADPDGDGLSNLAEHAFGTDPADAASGFRPAASVLDGRLRIVVPRGAWPALRYAVEASSDLGLWTEIWSSQGAGNSAGAVTVTDTLDLPAGGRRFLRIVVTEP